MLHVLILADIEGIVGVYDLLDRAEVSHLYSEEIRVYVNTLLRNNIERITVCDAHNKGNMINYSVITDNGRNSKRVTLISQTSQISFAEHYDFAIMVGYHGMGGKLGILAHTYRNDIKSIKIIDEKKATSLSIGEVEVDARWLGSKGIPVVLVTGDSEAIQEANHFNSYRHVCCVKSIFEITQIDKIHYYKKLTQSVEAAIKLNKELCLSYDSNKIAVDFINADVVALLAKAGFGHDGNRLVFDNCASFIDCLEELYDALAIANHSIMVTNLEFLKEIRKLVSTLNKEDIVNSEIGALLNHNLITLDEFSRSRIFEKVKQILSEVN